MARFEDVCASLWDDDSGYGVQPPLTDYAVGEAERLLGVRLPAAFVEVLRRRNGGAVAPAREAFPTREATTWSADHVPFDHVMGIGDREGSLLDSPYLVGEWGLPDGVVVVSVNAPCFVALDYRTGGPHGEPSVTWFDAEVGTELGLAPDFRSFVEGLGPEPDAGGGEGEGKDADGP